MSNQHKMNLFQTSSTLILFKFFVLVKLGEKQKQNKSKKILWRRVWDLGQRTLTETRWPVTVKSLYLRHFEAQEDDIAQWFPHFLAGGHNNFFKNLGGQQEKISEIDVLDKF